MGLNYKISESAFDRLKTLAVRKDYDTSGTKGVLYVTLCNDIRELAAAHNIHIADTNIGVFEYDGKCWKVADKRTVQNKLGEIAEALGISASMSMQFRFREDMLKQYQITFYRELPQQNAAEVKINLNNGTLNVTTSEFSDHDPDDMFQYVLPFDYDPTAECTRFLKFLEEVVPDEDARLVIQEYIGYLFVFGLKLEKFLTLFGGGSNGKSVLLDVISAMLGDENVTAIPLQSLCRENSCYIPRLSGKLANICNDVGNKIEDTSVLKRLASQ